MKLICYINPTKYGKKIIVPMVAAAMAHISTAPAAMSLTSPANLLYSGETKLTNLSIAVLNASAAKTKAMHSMMISHSVVVMWHTIPRTTTPNVRVVCIQALCSLLIKLPIPFQAYVKLFKRLFILNFSIALITTYLFYPFYSL